MISQASTLEKGLALQEPESAESRQIVSEEEGAGVVRFNHEGANERRDGTIVPTRSRMNLDGLIARKARVLDQKAPSSSQDRNCTMATR